MTEAVTGSTVTIIGEVLFDCFPDGSRTLGGAPFNVAWHLSAFGVPTHFVSRVGNDGDGRRVRAAARTWGLSDAAIQTDDELPTGRVDIRLEDGEPEYEIVHPVAYDRLAVDPGTVDAATARSSWLYHGSLAFRDRASRAALEALRAAHAGPVFVDVNLRDPWWSRERVLADLEAASWVKLNEEELRLLSDHRNAEQFRRAFSLAGLILTRGAAGAEVHRPGKPVERVAPEPAGPFVDAVGAGDAFAAVVLTGLANGWPIGTTLERAQAFASRIVGQRGATVLDRDFYRSAVNRWSQG